MIGALKAAARRLDRFRAFHVPALALVRRLNRHTFRRLRREPVVAAVYLKGSFVRGPFRPFASDVDLALVLRDRALAAGGAPAVVLGRLCRTLRAAKRTNPSVRDWWQHLVLESELPLVERFWYLYGADEWRDEAGARPPIAMRPAGDAGLRRLVQAHWAQQCAWSASAVQKAIDPRAPFHDFDAGRRKAAFYASRLCRLAERSGSTLGCDELFELRRRHALELDREFVPRTSGPTAWAELFRDLESSARVVAAESGGGPSATALPTRGGSVALPGAPACVALVVGERTLHAVVRDGAAGDEIERVLAALRRPEAPRRPLGFLVPAGAAPWWPRGVTHEPPEVLGAAIALGAAPGERERLLFDALFLPSALRLALGFADRQARLRRTFWSLGRALLLYRDGDAPTTHRGIAARLRELAAGLDVPGLGTIVAGLAGGEEPAWPADARLFEVGSAMARELVRALGELEPEARSPAAERAHA